MKRKSMNKRILINILVFLSLSAVGLCGIANCDASQNFTLDLAKLDLNLTNNDSSLRDERSVRNLMYNLPLNFVENKGQVAPEVKYIIKAPEESIFFALSRAVFVLSSGSNSSAVNMTFEGASPKDVLAENPSSGKVNFLLGNDSTKWVTDLPTYAAIRYDDLYPGIDLVFRGTEGTLKHEFLVDPGSDPDQIVLAYDGQSSLSLDDNGSLIISTPTGELTDYKPFIYQL